jgi:adenine phosphoribosyltransferase
MSQQFVDLTERELVARAVRESVYDVDGFPHDGVVFKDITPVLLDPALFRRVTGVLAESFRTAGITHVVAIESRGFIFGAPIAQQLEAAFVPVRKPGKLPRAHLREGYDLEYGSDALEMHADALTDAKGVLVVDDLLATGGTAAAAARLVARTGARVAAYAFVIELAFLGGRPALGDVRIETLVTY